MEKVFGFTQLRGSIPLVWSSTPNFRYNPKIKIINRDINYAAGHFHRILQSYQSVYCINLIDKKGQQLEIGNGFTQCVEKIKSGGARVGYFWFDFHKECRKMKYENLGKLVGHVEKELEQFSFFEMNITENYYQRSNGAVFQNIQRGVFRTNCIDNLDRTNVVQSVLA